MKSIEQNFTDWEADTFGFGYGTGEAPILLALQKFLTLCCHHKLGHAYEYTELEATLAPTVAWLLINALCHADIIEYGTSPRYGWLTGKGQALKQFMIQHTVGHLEELTSPGEQYIHCYPDHCNCDAGDCRPGNPFWGKRP